MIIEKQLPANEDTERAVLGSILFDNGAIDQAAMKLTVDSFSLDSHRKIYSAMLEMSEHGIAIDFNTLTEQLGKDGNIIAVGGAAYVTDLTNGLPRVKNIGHYCDILVDKYFLRQIIHVSTSAMAASYEQSDSGKRTLDYMIEQLLTLQANGNKNAAVQPKDFSDHLMSNMADMKEKRSRLIGFSLGLDGLNHRTTGVRKKELCVVGGRPGQGKTAWALQAAADNCANGIGVGFFSLEMDKESLLQRLYAAHANIDFTRIRVPYLLQDLDNYALVQAKQEIDTWPLFIDDDADGEAGLSISEIKARMRLLKRQHGVRFFFVDFIQLVSVAGRDPREKVTKIVRGLRRFAKTEDVAIVALSQLSRAQGNDKNRKPTMHDFMESGEIEQAAHIAMIPWWPIEEESSVSDDKWMLILKQRNGETWEEPVRFVGKYQRYEAR